MHSRGLLQLALSLAVLAVSSLGSAAYAAVDPPESEGRAPRSSAFEERLEAAFVEVASPSESESIIIQREKWQNEFYQEVWEWNHFTGQVIFWVVIAIVIFGMAVSGIQFRGDLARSQLRKRIDAAGEASTSETSNSDDHTKVVVSMTRMEMQTKTIGALILVASIAFLLIYLKYIYPMNVVRPEDEKIPFFSQADEQEDGHQATE